jgi:predicted amidohydrolase
VTGASDRAAPAREALRLTLVQADTVWHDAAANRRRLEDALASHAGRTDVVILPETFTTGFSNEAVATAEGMDGPSVAWMRAQARALDAAVTGSLQVREGDAVYNRLVWATPDDALQCYDKRHLFRMAREHERYASGSARLVVTFRGWRILPLVCYDLRFPVFSRNRATGTDLEYDLLLYVANWPAARHEHWRTLLRARAIENLACVAGVNRAGTDGNGHPYAGGSTVIDAMGQVVVECDAAAQVADAVVSLEALRAYRARFPAQLDADRFTLEE